MDYRRFDNYIVARINRGEELLAALQAIAEQENVALAQITGLGASNDFDVGVLDMTTHVYNKITYTGDYEIVSLTGTISRMNGEYYAHLHMSAGNADGVVGGHLNRAVISATCEMVITVIPGVVDRTFSPDVGINLFDFDK